MLIASVILAIHDTYNRAVHLGQPYSELSSSELEMFVLRQHQANFALWHEEDKARTPDAAPTLIVDVKRNIDRLNQRRNDLVEQIDVLLLQQAEAQNRSAPLHSETPGLIIDRLSILSLKIFHTAEEAGRRSASPEHRARNNSRLTILTEQRTDLAACLDQLWYQVTHGERRFKLYRQMKMYNDPELNPVLYGARTAEP